MWMFLICKFLQIEKTKYSVVRLYDRMIHVLLLVLSIEVVDIF